MNVKLKVLAQRAVFLSKLLICTHKCANLCLYFIGMYKELDLGEDVLLGNLVIHNSNCRSMSKWHRDLLYAWNKLNIVPASPIISKADVLKQPLFYNRLLPENMYCKKLVDAGATRVQHLWDDHRKVFLSHQHLCIYFVDITLTFYDKLMASFPDDWRSKQTHADIDNPSSVLYTVLCGDRNVSHSKFTTKLLYNNRLSNINPPVSLVKWNNIFNTQLKPTSVYTAYNDTLCDNYVRDLHWKLQHMSLPTTDFLFRCDITEDNICPSCDDVENNIHVFTDCFISFQFWTRLLSLLQNITKSTVNLVNLFNICFGFYHLSNKYNARQINLCNFLVNYGRAALWHCRNKRLEHSIIIDPYVYFKCIVTQRIKQEHWAAGTMPHRKDKFVNIYCINSALCHVDANFKLSINL